MASNLEKAVTFFMMPFYIKEKEVKEVQKFLSENSSIWERSKMSIDKGILYSHIQEFLSNSVTDYRKTGKVPSEDKLAAHDYRIYSLSKERNRFLGMLDKDTEHVAFVKISTGGKNVLQAISFRFNNSDKDYPQFFSPKLIICPNSQVGLLLFSIELLDYKDTEHLSKLNYALFKDQGSQSSNIFLPKQVKLLKEEEDINSIRKQITKNIQAIRKLKNRAKESRHEKAKAIDKSMIEAKNSELKNSYQEYKEKHVQFLLDCRNRLQLDERVTAKILNIDKALGNKTPDGGYNIRELLEHNWTMSQLTECLMSDLRGKYIRADEFRLHVFTYLQVNEVTSHDPNLLTDFSRIIRCQDEDYLVLPSSFGHPVYEQLFENVYIGSTVEGGGVLVSLRGRGDDFMKSFDKGPLTHSYLWVYILAVMQRHTLLQMSRELAEEYGYSGKDLESRLEHLRKLMRKMSKTKINTYFTDVSDHSHLNALYSFCCKNLSVDRYFADVDNKLATLKETLEQLHDEQMEAYKRHEKKMDNVQNKILKWVAVFALALTLFSGLNDSYDYFSNFLDAESSPATHALIVIFIIVSVFMIAWRVVEGIQNKYINGDNNKTTS